MATNAHAAETISGTVRAASTNQPLVGIDLDVFDASGSSVALTGGTTDATGQYSLTLPAPGTYTVRADPTIAQPYGAQFYAGTALKSAAQPLVVGVGAAVTGIDFSLPRGFLLSGRVTSSGAPVADVDIDVFAATGEYLSAYPARSQLDGTYTVGALPAGTYYVRADPDITRPEQLFVTGYFGGATNLAAAAPISIASANVASIDIALVAGGTIKGLVTGLDTGLPLAGIDLDIFDLLGNVVSAQATTAADGTYEIGAVASGSYLLRVDPTVAQGYARTYYDGSLTNATATSIAVVAGNRTPNINFAVVRGGTLSGVIRRSGNGVLLADIDLDLYDANRNLMAGYTTKSDATGNFQLGPLQPGVYFLRADPTVVQGFAEQFYSKQTDIGTANPVAVTADTNTAGVNFSLLRAGAIAGTVRDESAMPISGIDLDLFDAAGVRLRKGATSGVDGTYTFTSLVPGAYTLRADPTAAQGFARIYFDNAIAQSVADPVTVVAGSTTTAVDLTLPLGATVSGQVNDANGDPFPAIAVEVLQLGTSATLLLLDQAATTDVSGAYTVAALPEGSYLVRAVPNPTLSPAVYYGDTTDDAQATVLPVAAGQDIIGIDIGLPFILGATLCGDANGNGQVQASDALIALRTAVGTATCALAACDVDSNGGVTATDASRILARAVNPSITLVCPAGV